jgi:uncharacterized protein YgiM (DUF1202 family)
MKKDTIIRVASILGVATILYLVYRKVVRPIVKEDKKDGVKPQDGVTPTPTPTPTDSDYEKYIVTTTSTSLNVRETPSASGKKIGSLKKGQQVLLKKSTTDGWMELTTNGKVTMGYVSSQYVTKQEATSNFVGDSTFVDDGRAIVNRSAKVEGRALVNKL